MVILLLFLAQVAQPELFKLELLPQWELQLVDGVKMGCYNEEGVKELRRVDLKYKSVLSELAITQSINTDLSTALKLHNNLGQLAVQNIDIYKTLLADKNEALRKMGERVGQLESQTTLADSMPMILVSAALVFVAGVVVGGVVGYYAFGR
jgi:hypothetical protein